MSAPIAENGNKWVFINGSPHSEGHTQRLAERFLQTLGSVQVTRVDCFAQKIQPCDDCKFCYRQEACSKRDMDDIYRAIEEADGLLFATPVYHNGFPAPMKAVIDRFQRYWAARFIHGKKPPVAKAKKAVLLTVSGSCSDRGGSLLQAQLEPPLTVLHATLCATVHIKETDSREVTAFDLEQVERAAQQLK